MKTLTHCITVGVILMTASGAWAQIGPPAATPTWPDRSPTGRLIQVGWQFTSGSLGDGTMLGAPWNTVGALVFPSWDYSLDRWYPNSSVPAQWKMAMPHFAESYKSNDLWICYVYERMSNWPSHRSTCYTTKVPNGSPTPVCNVVVANYPEEYFKDLSGTVAGNSMEYNYARFSQLLRIAPDMTSLDLWIGLDFAIIDGTFKRLGRLREVYVMMYATYPPLTDLTFTPGAGTYNDIQSVVVACTTTVDSIRYTLDGTDPTLTSPLTVANGGTVVVASSQTLKARAFRTNYDPSPVKSASYVLQVKPVRFDPADFSGDEPFTVAVTCDTPNVTIQYTKDGSDPWWLSPVVANGGSLLVDKNNMALKAQASRTGWTSSLVSRSSNYVLTVKTPTLTPNGGAFTSAVLVQVHCATPGATLYYTLNGVDPTIANLSVVSGQFVNVAGDLTLKVRAFKTDWQYSQVAKADFMAGAQEVYLGGVVTPPADVLFTTNRPPGIRSPDDSNEVRAVFIHYGTYPTNIVLATNPGLLEIDWWTTGLTNRKKLYVVLNTPQVKTRKLYWTEAPSKGPLIDVTLVPKVTIHYNNNIPPPDSLTNQGTRYQYVWIDDVRKIHAQGGAPGKGTGYLVMTYEGGDDGPLLGVEVVDVVRNTGWLENQVHVGSQLIPAVVVSNSSRPFVSRGLSGTSSDFIYRHDVPGKMDGSVFAIAENGAALVEVFWTEKGLADVSWPYEMDRYTITWPATAQTYVRGRTPSTLGPSVAIPGTLYPILMSAEKYGISTHHGHLDNSVFWSDGAGYSLIRYLAGVAGDKIGTEWVGFQVIKSVIDTNDAVFSLAPNTWPIGIEITNANHQGGGSGYIHTPEGTRYEPFIYTYPATNSQVFGVNTGTLEVWWCNLALSNWSDGIRWPSFVMRYQNVWPTSGYEKIVVASTLGSGKIDIESNVNWSVYWQNDTNSHGFNPNDEHAMMYDGRVFALRDDLGTPETSEPFVLMKYQSPAAAMKWKMRLFKPVAEEGIYTFDYSGTAGKLIQAPMPLSVMPGTRESVVVSGPGWKDRKNFFWARAAGDRGESTNIVLRFYYPVLGYFYVPAFYQANIVSNNAPLLDVRAGSTGTPIDVTYIVSWKTNYPSLRVCESLVKSKYELPSMFGQSSVEIIYQQSRALANKDSVKLIDPTQIREVPCNKLPSDVETSVKAGNYHFPLLPPHLRNRIWFDPIQKKLRLQGEYVKMTSGENYLLLNVISPREGAVLQALSTDAASGFPAAMQNLCVAAANPIVIATNITPFDSLALTAGLADGTGLVTIAFGNSPTLSAPSEPISLEIFEVEPPLHQGEIRAVVSDNAFDEKLTLRHSGDFAGKSDQYTFEWRTLPPDEDGSAPSIAEIAPQYWTPYPMKPYTGAGVVDITIEGPGIFTLADNYFICRYKRTDGSGPTGSTWSQWAEPMLAEGWIKRVLNGVNPFEQRYNDFGSRGVNTLVSMIAQAGTRWRGNVPLNTKNVDDFGLIEIYETILKRGMDLSIEGLPPLNYGPANDALLLVAGRISDLYMLLGNEAYADAADPTIAFGTDDAEYGSEATSLHCFMNQTATLLEEELDLLRGRDNKLAPSVKTFPFYNRLIWNFTRDITGGEVAYSLNYNIYDVNDDGVIDEADARILFPQAHGDAWGHYLMATKVYYRLLRNKYFDWMPRIEAVLVGGVPVSVDYYDERKFAKSAAQKAQTGAEIINLTYRQNYVENVNGQWQGYTDSNTNRMWGFAEWGSRVGQGAYFDWIVGNAVLPPVDPNPQHTGIQKIDRTTVSALADIASAFATIQTKVDEADTGLNPLGLSRNAIPFDLDMNMVGYPSDRPLTHFDQIYERASKALQNAVTVFDHAKNSTQNLRRQNDSIQDFQGNVEDQETDFENRLIEIFGYPYSDDIGPLGSYSSGYNGPDLYHWMYVNAPNVADAGVTGQQVVVPAIESVVNENGGLVSITNMVTYRFSDNGLMFSKPAAWTGMRRAQGELQLAYSDVVQLKQQFEQATLDYKQGVYEIEMKAKSIVALVDFRNATSNRQEEYKREIKDLNLKINIFQGVIGGLEIAKMAVQDIEQAIVSAAPGVMGVIAGLAGGVIVDPKAFVEPFACTVAQIANYALTIAEKSFETAIGVEESLKEYEEIDLDIALTAIENDFPVKEAVSELKVMVKGEKIKRIELFRLEEQINQAVERIRALLAGGQRTWDARTGFRQQTAAHTQSYRYKDMAFRIFRDDALQKYRAQFDLAARYAYLAAKAYDFETALEPNDPRGSGLEYLTDIVRARAIGLVNDGQPVTGSGSGDPGLADVLAKMWLNWDLVLRSQLGLNNPTMEKNQFSFRAELFRSVPEPDVTGRDANLATDTGLVWRSVLQSHVVSNFLALPEFQRYCIPPQPHNATEPAIVIPFATTVGFGKNFFGWPLGGADSSYDSSQYATKIAAAGIVFANYDTLGLASTPRVYLVPVGSDTLRCPSSDGIMRQWRIFDQALPVPFPVSAADLTDPGWIPINDTLATDFGALRRFPSLRAYNDPGAYDDQALYSTGRLFGRSAWNTKWLLIIPAGALHSDRDLAIARFVDGVTDIKLLLDTFSYSGTKKR